jgi:hypothetical protein
MPSKEHIFINKKLFPDEFFLPWSEHLGFRVYSLVKWSSIHHADTCVEAFETTYCHFLI